MFFDGPKMQILSVIDLISICAENIAIALSNRIAKFPTL